MTSSQTTTSTASQDITLSQDPTQSGPSTPVAVVEKKPSYSVAALSSSSPKDKWMVEWSDGDLAECMYTLIHLRFTLYL